MKIAIRVDSSQTIGTGHVRRMAAVAHALRAWGAEVVFVSRDLTGHAAKLVREQGFTLRLLPAPRSGFVSSPSQGPHAAWAQVDQVQDAEETIAVLRNFSAKWVMVDHYAFDAVWHTRVQAALGSRLAVVDDLADRKLVADLVIDHNFHPDHRRKFADVLKVPATLLAGPRFAMLGPTYRDAPRHVFHERVNRVGIFLGGVDARKDTLRALDALHACGFAGSISIASTEFNPHLSELRAVVAARPACSLVVNLPDLAGFFAEHDLQIGAGGGAIWERCCIGAPTLCLISAENQRSSVPELDAIGALVAHDMLNTTSRGSSLGEKIAALLSDPERRQALRDVAMDLVDGRGADRIASALISNGSGVMA